jgi:hypothetical protein
MTAARHRLWADPVGLAAVLAVQALLSLRLRNTVFLDEAGYLSAGHCQLGAWLHHGPPCEHYARYFSGAPFLYPVPAAAVDGIGGLAAARLLSLAFMLLTTALVWGTARRLFGRSAAFFAAAAFAVSGPVLFLGHFATFDAAALCGLALALWLVAWDRRGRLPPILAGLVLGLAVAVKYAALAFAPTVVVVAGLLVTAKIGSRAATLRAATVAGTAAAVLGGILFFGGRSLLDGLSSTTTNRATASATTESVLRETAELGLALFVIALAGAAIYLYSDRYEADQPDGVRAVTGFVLAGTALIAPLSQVHIHTTVSLHKHVAFGLMFAAPLAGLALSWLAAGAWYRAVAPVAVVAGLVVAGAVQSQALFTWWPDSSAMVARLSAQVTDSRQQVLAEGIAVPRYYLGSRIPIGNWHNPASPFSYTHDGTPLTGLPAFEAAFADRYFTAVVLNDAAAKPLDQQLITLMRTHGYREVALLPTRTHFGSGTYSIWGPDVSQAKSVRKKKGH